MCGRAYETYTDEELYFRYSTRRSSLPPLSPVYNLCPTMDSPVLRVVADERRFDALRWQLVPKLATINARSETVFESRLYRDIVVRQRCIVPLSGFFEWKEKKPFKIYLPDEPIMSVAGIWDGQAFAILTTAANEFMRGIHDRMPVILGRSDEQEWLDPEVHEQDTLRKLMKPCPSKWLAATAVSTLVNSTKNNTPEVLEEAKPERLPLFSGLS